MASIDGPLRRVMTRPIDRPPIDRVRDSTRRRDSTTRDGHGAARRVERLPSVEPTPGSAAKLRELQSRCVSTDRPIDRSTDRARVVTRRAAFEWNRRLTVCLPLDARARRMDRMRRMSASGRDDEREETSAVERETVESAERVRTRATRDGMIG